ncbi:SH3 domain-containing protein [Archangium primigenium]|uniref:SH3 domain-containing protein n=1 Tax=[Archangium] primigenium TaxID=2792470 RepID=UPI0019574C9E|nr:SH3 domain-containing protein [Archangium primigenium]MBM7112237.1 hypothetical protein [Archangium primigenium]
MRGATKSGHPLKWVAVLAWMAVGCGGGQTSVDGTALVGVDEGESASAITACVTSGASLQTTTDLNVRSGVGTSYGVLITIPGGGIAKEAGGGCPTSGWYKVTYSGVTGWASGTYLTVAGTGSTASRDAAIARSQTAMGFSYWWGHGAFKSGAAVGACSGNCPSCTHSGSYGGDCSGFVAKAWVVPSTNSNMATDSHPYSTGSFNVDSSQWSTISRDALLKADALVYNDGGAGHIALYGSGDGWGSMNLYECKGCAAGCVYNARSLGTTYHAIRHY